MINLNDFVVLIRTQIAGWDAATGLIVASGLAALVMGLVLRAARARATKRLRSVLDIYADRQIAMNVLARDPASSRQSLLSLDSTQTGGLVMGVAGVIAGLSALSAVLFIVIPP